MAPAALVRVSSAYSCPADDKNGNRVSSACHEADDMIVKCGCGGGCALLYDLAYTRKGPNDEDTSLSACHLAFAWCLCLCETIVKASTRVIYFADDDGITQQGYGDDARWVSKEIVLYVPCCYVVVTMAIKCSIHIG